MRNVIWHLIYPHNWELNFREVVYRFREGTNLPVIFFFTEQEDTLENGISCI